MDLGGMFAENNTGGKSWSKSAFKSPKIKNWDRSVFWGCAETSLSTH
jgi:hypothetical protein